MLVLKSEEIANPKIWEFFGVAAEGIYYTIIQDSSIGVPFASCPTDIDTCYSEQNGVWLLNYFK